MADISTHIKTIDNSLIFEVLKLWFYFLSGAQDLANLAGHLRILILAHFCQTGETREIVI